MLSIGTIRIPFDVGYTHPSNLEVEFPVGNQLYQQVRIPNPPADPFDGWGKLRSIEVQDVPDDENRRFSTLAMFAAVRQHATPFGGDVHHVCQTLSTDIALRGGIAMHLKNTPFYWGPNNLAINYGPCRGIFHLTHGRLDLMTTQYTPHPEYENPPHQHQERRRLTRQHQELADLVHENIAATQENTAGKDWFSNLDAHIPSDRSIRHLSGLLTCRLCLLPQAFRGRPTLYLSPHADANDAAYVDHRVDPLACIAHARACRGSGVGVEHGSTATVTRDSWIPAQGDASQQVVLEVVETATALALSEAPRLAPDTRLEPHPDDVFTLLPFQTLDVEWMVGREAATCAREWNNLGDLVAGLWYSPILKQFQQGDPVPLRGGYIMHSMGMGKTCTVLGLCQRNPRATLVADGGTVASEDLVDPVRWLSATSVHYDPSHTPGGTPEEYAERVRELPGTQDRGIAGTLIVVPASLLTQWRDEVRTKTPHLTVGVYYGARERVRGHLLSYDVVLTTYRIVASEDESVGLPPASVQRWHRRTHGNRVYAPPLARVHWTRIVLDEAHTLRIGTQVGAACCRLEGAARWCLTGTPCPDGYEDLVHQATFLRDPMLQRMGQRRSLAAFRYAHRSQETLWRLLTPVARRVTPDTRVHGLPVARFPPPETIDYEVDMDTATAAAYAAQRVTASDTIRASSSGIVAVQQLNILRQIVSGVQHDAAPASDSGSTRFTGVLVPGVQYGDGTMCPVCFEPPDDPAQTPCGHTFCTECLLHWYGARTVAPCPCCRQPVNQTSVTIAPRAPPPRAETPRTGGAKFAVFRALVSQLGDAKMLVFTQFNETLAQLAAQLAAQVGDAMNIKHFTIDGGMSATARGQVIHRFNTCTGPAVFLLTVRAGACGINLTAATRVLLFEPALHTSTEAQAVSRAVRIGQANTVRVERIVTRGTVESAILVGRGTQRLNRSRILHIVGGT